MYTVANVKHRHFVLVRSRTHSLCTMHKQSNTDSMADINGAHWSRKPGGNHLYMAEPNWPRRGVGQKKSRRKKLQAKKKVLRGTSATVISSVNRTDPTHPAYYRDNFLFHFFFFCVATNKSHRVFDIKNVIFSVQ